jgi:hypothetical protein
VEERRLRVGSLFEWALAATGVALLIWLISVPVQRALGPRVEAAPVDAGVNVPAGVPPGAMSVPVMLLLDGRELRAGDSHARLHTLLPDKLAEGPAHITGDARGSERHTRAYVADGIRFFVVCERPDSGGAMRVQGIYVP